MNKYKKFLLWGNIFSLIASILTIILECYFIVHYSIEYSSNTEFADSLFYYLIIICIASILLAILNLALTLKAMGKLKLDNKHFIQDQNLYIWLCIILGFSLLAFSIFVKIFFAVSLVLVIIGLVKANKMVELSKEQKEEYDKSIENINLLYESKIIDENKKNELIEKINEEFYSNK